MRYTHLWLAATHLLREGRISAFEAVYRFTTPDGFVKRNTRLAATIWTLRNTYGWDIKTIDVPGHLAEYVLVKPGRLPDGVTGPATPPKPPVWVCQTCGNPTEGPVEPRLGGFAQAMCQTCAKRTMFREREA